VPQAAATRLHPERGGSGEPGKSAGPTTGGGAATLTSPGVGGQGSPSPDEDGQDGGSPILNEDDLPRAVGSGGSGGGSFQTTRTGSGGEGFYGGGGGGGYNLGDAPASGGGGGSSYVESSALEKVIINASGRTPGNANDSDRCNIPNCTVGEGDTPLTPIGATAGTGRIIVRFFAELPSLTSITPSTFISADGANLVFKGQNFVQGAVIVIEGQGKERQPTLVSSCRETTGTCPERSEGSLQTLLDSQRSYGLRPQDTPLTLSRQRLVTPPNRIEFNIPAGAAPVGTYDMAIKNPDGQISNYILVTVTQASPPILTSITPSTFISADGANLVFNGENFLDGAVIVVEGQGKERQPTLVTPPNRIEFNIPAGAAPAGTYNLGIKNYSKGLASNFITITITNGGASPVSLMPNLFEE